MYASLAEQASESDWSQEERDQWYKERPKNKESTASSGSSSATA